MNKIKIKGFEELEDQDLKDFSLYNFRKSRLKEVLKKINNCVYF